MSQRFAQNAALDFSNKKKELGCGFMSVRMVTGGTLQVDFKLSLAVDYSH